MSIADLEAAPAADSVDGLMPRPGRSSRVRVDGKRLSKDGRRFQVQGVTYGPFAANLEGQPFPAPQRVADDFARMIAGGVNALRTYHVPPAWFLQMADEHDLAVFLDVPWRKHLCFLDSAEARHEARRAVQMAAKSGREHSCLLAYSIGNEISSDIIRWHGWHRVERFLAELADVVRQTDPDGLVTYASYPPTEYLDLSFLDFATFNVYLHDRQAFRRYVFRLQNLVGDRPLLLGELGMDTLRHGETEQARFLAGHVAEAQLMGLAGAFVFAWTDDWFTGGHPIENWKFGVTHADRIPKASYHALRELYESTLPSRLPAKPRVSVVVCSYNGGRTLDQCLRSLQALNYPDYEVIVVDDGSTDDTGTILTRFPAVRAIRQTNQGLSAARNVGLQAASGALVAYTDSDCFVDPDWLTHLVYQIEQSGASAVGGPNLTPEDGWLAACVAAAPGQPTHVLESDQVAEHIPGCNMAFRRDALVAINGFDPIYRKAGDDVDVCWRLQQAGMWITFAPGAFVWHHRRQGLRTYLRQQGGYGEAEALLRFKHPEKFNGRGDGKWRGVLYGAALSGLRLGGATIYRGVFATGYFQSIYQPGPAHWAMLPATLEWHLGAAILAVLAFLWWPAGLAAALMLGLSGTIAFLQARQAKLPSPHRGLLARGVIATLCYLQPVVRSWWRYRTRLFAPRTGHAKLRTGDAGLRLSLVGRRTLAYWSAGGCSRTDLLAEVVARLAECRWGTMLDSGWSEWDLEVACRSWTLVEVCTAQEEHGSNKRLIRVRYQLRPRASLRWLVLCGSGLVLGAGGVHAVAAILLASMVGTAAWVAWWQGARQAAGLLCLFDEQAAQLGLIRCDGSSVGRESPR